MHRTLLITHFFPPQVGGAERYCEVLARRLPASDLVVVASPTVGDHDFDRTLPVPVIRKNFLKPGLLQPSWLLTLSWLVRTIKQERVTRVVFGHYAGFVTLGLLVKLVLGIPFVISVFGLDFIAYRRSFWRRLLLRWNLRAAEWVITISSYTAGLLRNFGVPQGKMLIAAPGTDPHEPPDQQSIERFRSTYGLGQSTILLTVGRLVQRKGHARVLHALPAVIQTLPDLRYVMVGDGPELTNLERLVRELNLQHHVTFLGQLSDHDVRLAFHASHAFIMLPSTSQKDAEGFGIVYIEALIAKKPIIATRSGGVVDIIRDGENGVALNEDASARDIAQAIVSLMRNRPRMQALGQQGFAFVQKHFSLDQQVAPFRRVLATPPREAGHVPTVSIIIPVWNSSDTVARTLQSVAVQTYKDLEVILVDDGSTDNPAIIAQRFPKVRLIRQDHRGAAIARNHGFRESRGRYVLFCDADVILHPRMLERMVTTLDLKPEAAYAYASFRFGWRTFDLFDFDRKRLQHANYISTMSMIRREAFPGFDETLPRLQDWDLWLTMLEQGKTGTWVPARLFSASVAKRGISQRISVPPLDVVNRIRQKHRLA